MDLKGRLVSRGEVKTFDSGFMLEEFYIDATRYNQDTGQKYSNYVKLQNANEKLNLDMFSIGDSVNVSFSVNGRFYSNQEQETRHSQNLNAYKIELVKSNSELPEITEKIDFHY